MLHKDGSGNRRRRRAGRTLALEALEGRQLMAGDSSFEFPEDIRRVSEAVGATTFVVNRVGDTSGEASISVRTRSTGAVEGYDYVPFDITLTFAPGQLDARFDLTILDDDISEPAAKNLVVEMYDAQGATAGASSSVVVTIDDDEPGSTTPLSLHALGDAGLWTFNVSEGYRKINGRSPEAIFPRGGRGAYLDFGDAGFWSWDALQGYKQLSTGDAEGLLAAPNNSQIIVDFGAGGVWTHDDLNGWAQINAFSPEAMAGTTASTLFDFGDAGLWSWSADSAAGTWTKINDANPEAIVAGGAGEGFYVDFGASGLWSWDWTGTWAQVSASDPSAMAYAGGRLTVSFAQGGLWTLDPSGTWAQINETAPRSFVAGSTVLFTDYGDQGLWMYRGGEWHKLDARSPEQIVIEQPDLPLSLTYISPIFLDLGPDGLWWTTETGTLVKLTDADATALAMTSNVAMETPLAV